MLARLGAAPGVDGPEVGQGVLGHLGPGPLAPVEGQGGPQALEGLGDRVGMLLQLGIDLGLHVYVYVNLQDLLLVGGGWLSQHCKINNDYN